jgi:predicted metalloendopeptidase
MAVNNAPVLGLMLGKAFSERSFAGDAKSKLTSMFLEIKAAFEDDVQTLSWLDTPTKAAALTKSHAMAYQLGYPDVWPENTLTYESQRMISEQHFAANVLLLNAHRFKSYVSLAGKPVDPNQWDTIASVVVLLPQTVTAFNAESPNQVIVPCGIAQLPLYDPNWPLAMRMGALGEFRLIDCLID